MGLTGSSTLARGFLRDINAQGSNPTYEDVDWFVGGSTADFKIIATDASIDGLGFFDVTPVNRPGNSEDIKDALVSLGLLTGGGSSALDLDGGKCTVGLLENEGGRVFHRITGGNVTVKSSDHLICITDSGSFARTVTLPAGHNAGQVYIVKDEQNASLNTITVATADADTIDGAATQTITTQYGVLRVYSDGTNWFLW